MGSDGALWFTESNVFLGKIGRITTAGAITEFPTPTGSSEPTGIAAGPDGALWFMEVGGQKIGRMTTAGAFTEYPQQVVSLSGDAFTAGPDGAMWFSALGEPHLQVPPL